MVIFTSITQTVSILGRWYSDWWDWAGDKEGREDGSFPRWLEGRRLHFCQRFRWWDPHESHVIYLTLFSRQWQWGTRHNREKCFSHSGNKMAPRSWCGTITSHGRSQNSPSSQSLSVSLRRPMPLSTLRFTKIHTAILHTFILPFPGWVYTWLLGWGSGNFLGTSRISSHWDHTHWGHSTSCGWISQVEDSNCWGWVGGWGGGSEICQQV